MVRLTVSADRKDGPVGLDVCLLTFFEVSACITNAAARAIGGERALRGTCNVTWRAKV